ncbi:bifunctional coenzyme A synthase-like [Penaeus chinensis]|uniref:bifunctional coenzyme A synthase-like n=1 Tax=Penaeus chinensis TaxID=139456 RepID=UPI001FB7C904|nr:bifunctional coenzyme A synthase-like [Penaeus chinensis]XP_047486499.1 bifunctional coenzyme A synthase-like [Penaeus chinensis]
MSSMTGLLILTQPVRKIIPRLSQTLKAASQHVNKTLYIHLDPLARKRSPELPQRLSLYSRLITTIYSESSSQCRGMEVRVLMAGFKHLSDVPQKVNAKVDLVLLDQMGEETELLDLKQRYENYLLGNKDKLVFLCKGPCSGPEELDEAVAADRDVNAAANKVFESVVVGGTFDHIHAGHKILLAEGLLRCSRKFTAGIAEGPLLKNKTLSELIAPCQDRIEAVKELVTDLDPTLDYHIVEITDPMGPTRWDPDMDMIVVSEETKKGIDIINSARKESELKPLEGYIISLVEDKDRKSAEEEGKVSSSSQRMRLLGTVIRPLTPNLDIPSHPHVIGLTGGSASGKSSVAKRFQKLGAGIVDCDKLGHEAYKKGTDCYNKLIQEFGKDIVASDGEINRRALGPKVFNNKDALEKLNSIVWPEIARLAKEQTTDLGGKGHDVVILDAAVLLEAKWEMFCHQVWVCIIKREEAIKRIVERDARTQEEAERRIDSQLSNKERVSRANVVFCTQWAEEYTQGQVERAWKDLQTMLRGKEETSKAQL